MAKYPAWSLLAIFSLLAVKVLSQDLELSDALDDGPTKAHFDLPAVDDEPTTQAPVEVITTTATTKASVKPKSMPESEDFDLVDALDPNNDIGGKDKNGKGDGQFSDDDLGTVEKDDTYKPDKGKGEREGGAGSDDDGYDSMAETGTIAGIISAVAMALVGAVSSYISYQKKKLCFSIQQGLNAEVTKGENPEAVPSRPSSSLLMRNPPTTKTHCKPPNPTSTPSPPTPSEEGRIPPHRSTEQASHPHPFPPTQRIDTHEGGASNFTSMDSYRARGCLSAMAVHGIVHLISARTMIPLSHLSALLPTRLLAVIYSYYCRCHSAGVGASFLRFVAVMLGTAQTAMGEPGEEAWSEEEEMDRDEAASLCSSSTLLCSSALRTSISFRLWCTGIWNTPQAALNTRV
ncbi:hypothetical protein JZ751_018698 [Albula glossodonta]|uniref:CD99 antigen-like protein 2 n=1 Tax=Albula glossodonta TaxID=121402 RepID=A0A8T2NMN9_9TELE|nr:hypothetical protein JZ751_018698 [Albula glossodonta]